MIVKTLNTIYTLTDLGDGAFEVQDRKSTNHYDSSDVLPKGTKVRFYSEPKVGEAWWGEKISIPDGSGAKISTFHTSRVVEIIP